MSKRKQRRPTWRRNAKGNVEYRFGDDWLEHYRSVSSKAERDKIVNALRKKGHRVRTRTRSKGHRNRYVICRRRK